MGGRRTCHALVRSASGRVSPHGALFLSPLPPFQLVSGLAVIIRRLGIEKLPPVCRCQQATRDPC